jgi:hypothetical protein
MVPVPVTVAALYVDPAGVYAGLEDVEVWDEARDARLYDGPWPVVAHPPCRTWSLMGQCRPEIVTGDDGGCFEAALAAVREFGGVLEHPAHSKAWRRFGLARPPSAGWGRTLDDEGWTCEVDQRWYGHEARKPTWLYAFGVELPALIAGTAPRGERTVGRGWGGGREHLRAATPPAFRDTLLVMARSVDLLSPSRGLEAG